MTYMSMQNIYIHESVSGMTTIASHMMKMRSTIDCLKGIVPCFWQINNHRVVVICRLVPVHRPGLKQRPAGRSGRSGRSIMIQLPICLLRSGLALSHPIAGELESSLWGSVTGFQPDPARKQRHAGRRVEQGGTVSRSDGTSLFIWQDTYSTVREWLVEVVIALIHPGYSGVLATRIQTDVNLLLCDYYWVNRRHTEYGFYRTADSMHICVPWENAIRSSVPSVEQYLGYWYLVIKSHTSFVSRVKLTKYRSSWKARAGT